VFGPVVVPIGISPVPTWLCLGPGEHRHVSLRLLNADGREVTEPHLSRRTDISWRLYGFPRPYDRHEPTLGLDLKPERIKSQYAFWRSCFQRTTHELARRDLSALLRALPGLYEPCDLGAFRLRVLSAIRRRVRCDSIVYNEVNVRRGTDTWFSEPADALDFWESHHVGG
jgi:hypothetical protein